jgi:hypothetical protein
MPLKLIGEEDYKINEDEKQSNYLEAIFEKD